MNPEQLIQQVQALADQYNKTKDPKLEKVITTLLFILRNFNQ